MNKICLSLYLLSYNNCVLDKPVIQIVGGCTEYTAICGEPVSIRATVTGVPTPTATWRFNNQNVMRDENFKIFQNGDMHEIKIFKGEFRYNGSYSITAVNTVGQAQKTVTLKVLG